LEFNVPFQHKYGNGYIRDELGAKHVLPNTNRTQAAEGAKNTIFIPGDLDLQTRPSERSNQSSVWIWQIHPAVPEVFHTQTENHKLMVPKTKPSAVHCVW